ncbi:MAG: ABC transporter substrate-binding protein [Hyphomicrobiaceae bacterium]|nr:ABC transporter substrate-binding protein [Hyphomicrobiaceae bacterium]
MAWVRWSAAAPLIACAFALAAEVPALAQGAVSAPPAVAAADEHPKVRVPVAYLGKAYEEPEPLSLVDKILTDNGVQGARVGTAYNVATGRLINQSYLLDEVIVAADADIVPAAMALLEKGERLIVADLEAEDLLKVADLPAARDAIILNVRSSRDELRGVDCRRNVFHVVPSWAMRADALAQYLLWKRWRRWFLISGQQPKDLEFVAAIRRAADRFGAKIVEEKTYTFDAGNRRTDDGHQQVQTQMPLLTQTTAAHDVVFAADASEVFGDFLMWRTFEPRPVVGTHGLAAVAWHRSFEQYAGTQMQNKFERIAKRPMTERDYAAWVAVRVIGEAVLRVASPDPGKLRAYILSPRFEVAGFKGVGMNFRPWDNQLRQPILLTGPRTLVSISPQQGFLHEKFLTDTLGYDEPETACRMAR